MRELDDLLLAYLEDSYPHADTVEKSAFETLLTLPNPELVGYLLKREQPQSEPIAIVVEHILERDLT